MNAVVTDVLLDIIEALLKLMHPADSNVVLGCTAFVLVVDSGVLA
jgi:hypothetical protein